MATYKNIKNRELVFSLNPEGDFIIPAGGTCELPEDNAHVKTLIASGYLSKINTNPKPPKK
jgi:hypothetical protein